jgi:hypothetical protein
VGGGRKLSRKLDGSFWVQAGDALPELLALSAWTL